MNIRQAYDAWAQNYDTVVNKTRDLEANALCQSLAAEQFSEVLEIGCGTGKNTEFLRTITKKLIGVDFSSEMLESAKKKITSKNVEFRQLDLREDWNFAANSFDLVTCSLVLEHIQNIEFVFAQAHLVLRDGGLFYIGELHPFKQYQGSKAKFETGAGIFELECFVHHVSSFLAMGKENDFEIVELKEWFDDNDGTQIPRILTIMFKAHK